MYQRLFPDQNTAIIWQAYVEPNGKCPIDAFFESIPTDRRKRLQARMIAWAEFGRWDSSVPWVKKLATKSPHTVYEVKSHQERVMFIRCANDAVAVQGFVKKNDWSKKDQHVLDAALLLVEATARDCRRGR